MIDIIKYLVEVTGILAAFAVFFGLGLSFLNSNSKKSGIVVSVISLVGVLLGLAEFLYGQNDPKGTNIALIRFNRWLIISVAAVLLVCLVFELICLFIKKKNRAVNFVFGALFALAAMLSCLYIVPQLLKLSTTFVYYGEDGFSTLALMRLLGYIFGIALAFLLSFTVFKVYKTFNSKFQRVILIVTLVLYLLDYGAMAVSALKRLKLIPLTDFVFNIMIIDDNYRNWFIYSQVILTAILALTAYFMNLRLKGSFSNNAQRRLEKAKNRRFRRFAMSLLIFSFLVPFTLYFLHYQDTKPPAEVSMENYELKENKIIIDTQTLSDGKLHKYEYKTPNGVNVIFLAVKKPAGVAYGLGLDACEICGTAGYFERGNEVICKRCDVVMNKNTIGFKGGCNPIPFPYEIVNGKIYIKTEDLIALEKKFR